MDIRRPRARFVELPQNRSALLAMKRLAAALRSGKSAAAADLYFLHGPSGTGKSRLLSQLARELPDIGLVSIDAGQGGECSEPFWKESSQAQLLLVEDVQLFPWSCAESLVELLDCRHAAELPTVVTSRFSPNSLRIRGRRVPARLAGRLAGGLVIALKPWPRSSRLSFLSELAQQRQLAVHPSVLDWLAENLAGSGRELEGAIQRLVELSRASPWPLELDVVKTQLQPPGVQSLTPLETILQGVARRFGVGWSELRSGRREREIVLPRQIAMYLGRRWTELSLDEIGTFFGGRDHTTVLHACQKIDRALAQDLTLTGIVQELEEDLHAAPVLCGKPVETV